MWKCLPGKSSRRHKVAFWGFPFVFKVEQHRAELGGEVGSSGPAIVCRSGPAASHPALEVQQQQQELTQRKRQHWEGFLLDPLCVCFGRAKLGLQEQPGEGRGEPQVARPSVSVLIFLKTLTRA